MNDHTRKPHDPNSDRKSGPHTQKGAQRCTLNHKHDASCDYGRKAASRHGDEKDSRQGSIRDPYSTGESHDLPSTSKDSDSDGWHRTSDRTHIP